MTVTGNMATGAAGGGILNLGTGTVSDVTVSSNTASGGSGMGGVGNVGGTMTLTRATVETPPRRGPGAASFTTARPGP